MRKNEPAYSVLVVDDDANIRNILQTFFREKGYACTVAGDGKEALEKFRQNAFNAVITDICMPILDGIALTKELKKISDIPVMVITGYHKIYNAETAMNSGADDYVTKPFSLTELHLRFQRMMRERELLNLIKKEKDALHSAGNEIIRDLQREAQASINKLQVELENIKKNEPTR